MEVEIKKISVVMCTYNGARFIREQLDSILNQTYPIYELIIQDDCSTDETVEIVKEYTSRDKRIKLFINSTPLGFNIISLQLYLKHQVIILQLQIKMIFGELINCKF